MGAPSVTQLQRGRWDSSVGVNLPQPGAVRIHPLSPSTGGSTVPHSSLEQHVGGLGTDGGQRHGDTLLALAVLGMGTAQKPPAGRSSLRCCAETALQQLQHCRVPRHLSASPPNAGEGSSPAPRFPVNQKRNPMGTFLSSQADWKETSPLGFVSFSVFHLKCFHCDLRWLLAQHAECSRSGHTKADEAL